MREGLHLQLKKLLAYSAGASAFLVSGKADAQTIYQNIDPDAFMDWDDTYTIDLNADGITDIGFHEHNFEKGFYDTTYYGSTTAFYVTYIRREIYVTGFDAVISDAILDHPLPLEEGFLLNSDCNWNEQDTVTLISFISTDIEFYAVDSLWSGENNYLGLRFTAGGENYFGWVRLSINNDHLVILDYGCAADANTNLQIDNPSASAATNVVLNDVTETQTAGDLQVTFTRAENENTVSLYRVFLLPDYGTVPDIATLDAYTYLYSAQVTPDNTDHTIIFDSTTLDMHGHAIELNHDYRAIVLSVPDGIHAALPDVSLPSAYEDITLKKAVMVYGVNIDADKLPYPIENTICTFNTYGDNFGTAEFQFYLLNTTYYDPDDLIALPDAYRQTIPVSDGNTYAFTIDPDILVYPDSVPAYFDFYYPVIVAVPDHIAATYATDDYGEDVRFLFEEPDLHLLATDAGDNGNGSDLRIRFTPPTIEENIDFYEIAVAPEADAADFTAEKMSALPDKAVMTVYPGEELMEFNWMGSKKDINGDPLQMNVPYIVEMTMAGFGSAVLTKPSGIVILDSIDKTTIVLSENTFYLHNEDYAPTTMEIYNLNGELLHSYPVPYGSSTIDLHAMQNGMYIAVIKNLRKTESVKFEILH